MLSIKCQESNEKTVNLTQFIKQIPEFNGREIRMMIHKKIIDVETDFNELAASQENFEIIKGKYLELPYLLKPMFDMTKQYEKSINELKKLLNI